MSNATLILDVETTEIQNRSVDKIHMIGTKDIQSGLKKNYFFPWNLEELENDLAGYTHLVGHNIIDFDMVQLKEHLGIDLSNHIIHDTLIMSKLYNPQLEDGHSLRAWGERLGFAKGDHEDWTKLSPEMITYCEQDLDVTHKVYEFLLDKLSEFPGESVELEHRTQAIITQQVQHGWLLDQHKCHDLQAQLKERTMELTDEVQDRFIPLAVQGKNITPKIKKDGQYSTVGLKFLGDAWTNVDGEFTRVDWPEFSLGSRQQIAKHLIHYGWKPKKFTPTGKPMVDDEVLQGVKIPEAQLIGEYMMIQKREGYLKSWLDKVESDGRVHGRVDPLGAVTGRMTHSDPNVAQVPAVYAPYGKDCRSCWGVPKGKKLVGIDASGLELRMLAHYMNDQEYTNEVVNGDVHTANQNAAGLVDRDTSKTFIYAFLYGAGDKKIGSIVGGSASKGKQLKEKFLDNTPSLRSLRERVEKAAEARGYLVGLDGRKLIARSPHSALNLLLQSAGAIIMKKGLTLLNEYAILHKIESFNVGNIHDEFQVEVAEEQAEKFGWLAVECIKSAGTHFKLRCPLDAKYKVGDTWAATH